MSERHNPRRRFPRNLRTFLLAYHSAMSLLNYTLLAYDKAQALDDSPYRIPERKILLIAMFGGWPGVYIAMEKLRHKDRNEGFKTSMQLATVGHLGLCGVVTLPGIEGLLRVLYWIFVGESGSTAGVVGLLLAGLAGYYV
ncbi:hypothetical protein BJ742DRAFT_800544 [Cladochytrium replicatum]|nr:hypothetical protein BJ742DRAFT_800544 [Cladochytrium replicatum]